jgi:hypothetical protein
VAETLLATWVIFDPQGKGYILAKDYIAFMLALKPPLVLGPDDYGKKYIQMSRELDKIYHMGYPSNEQDGYLDMDAKTAKEREAKIKKSPYSIYYKDEEGNKEMTFVKCFTLCRIYNVNLYIHNKQCVVHFKDVVNILAKIVIENKHKVERDIVYESNTIETMLMDRWVSNYPGSPRLTSAGHAHRADLRQEVRRPRQPDEALRHSVLPGGHGAGQDLAQEQGNERGRRQDEQRAEPETHGVPGIRGRHQPKAGLLRESQQGVLQAESLSGDADDEQEAF